MRLHRLLIPLLAGAFIAAGGSGPKLSVRFFAEGNARDGDSFSTPIKLQDPPREAYLQKVPVINEGQISKIFPFKAEDGTWGCAFKLDNDGRINLEVVSTDKRGGVLVGFVGTKRGNHRVADLIVDKTIHDGVITIPRGLTDLEMTILRGQFKVIGGDTGPRPKVKYRMWNPFRKKEPALAAE